MKTYTTTLFQSMGPELSVHISMRYISLTRHCSPKSLQTLSVRAGGLVIQFQNSFQVPPLRMLQDIQTVLYHFPTFIEVMKNSRPKRGFLDILRKPLLSKLLGVYRKRISLTGSSRIDFLFPLMENLLMLPLRGRL